MVKKMTKYTVAEVEDTSRATKSMSNIMLHSHVADLLVDYSIQRKMMKIMVRMKCR